jgi:hypothetical protein
VNAHDTVLGFRLASVPAPLPTNNHLHAPPRTVRLQIEKSQESPPRPQGRPPCKKGKESEEAQPPRHFPFPAALLHPLISSLSPLEPAAVLYSHCYSDPVREREHEPFVFGVSDPCGSQTRFGINQLGPNGAGGKDGGGETREVGGWAEGWRTHERMLTPAEPDLPRISAKWTRARRRVRCASCGVRARSHLRFEKQRSRCGDGNTRQLWCQQIFSLLCGYHETAHTRQQQ